MKILAYTAVAYLALCIVAAVLAYRRGMKYPTQPAGMKTRGSVEGTIAMLAPEGLTYLAENAGEQGEI